MLTEDAQGMMRWYQKNKRILPWRELSDPYAVMVSEIMLQQTTVAAVIPKYQRWMGRFPDVASLAEADLEEVLSHWSGLGYYQRARRLHQAARRIADMGLFPDTLEDLKSLPGFGPYTAAAVASICFERPELAADTNVIRVLFRYYKLAASASDRASLTEIKRRTRSTLETIVPGDFNQALMELGAGPCSVTRPSCRECPLHRGCGARASKSGPEAFPTPSPKKAPRKTPGLGLLLQDRDRQTLLLRGTSIGLLRDLFQPPLVFQEGEGPLAETSRTLLNSFGNSPWEDQWELQYGISGRRLNLECRLWTAHRKEVEAVLARLLPGKDYLWWKPEPETKVPVSTLTRKVLRLA